MTIILVIKNYYCCIIALRVASENPKLKMTPRVHPARFRASGQNYSKFFMLFV